MIGEDQIFAAASREEGRHRASSKRAFKEKPQVAGPQTREASKSRGQRAITEHSKSSVKEGGRRAISSGKPIDQRKEIGEDQKTREERLRKTKDGQRIRDRRRQELMLACPCVDPLHNRHNRQVLS